MNENGSSSTNPFESCRRCHTGWLELEDVRDEQGDMRGWQYRCVQCGGRQDFSARKVMSKTKRIGGFLRGIHG